MAKSLSGAREGARGNRWDSRAAEDQLNMLSVTRTGLGQDTKSQMQEDYSGPELDEDEKSLKPYNGLVRSLGGVAHQTGQLAVRHSSAHPHAYYGTTGHYMATYSPR